MNRIAAIVVATALLASMPLAAIMDVRAQGAADANSFEVTGISVDTRGKDAESARLAGWREAQRKAWQQLAQRMGRGGIALSDPALDGMVSAIVVEREQIGPTRYIARLGVQFSRERAGPLLGVSGRISQSAPMVLMPIEWSGGTGTGFERPGQWQDAWGRFRAGSSTIDYVRLAGTGPDPLLLNAGQAGRRGRGWWKAILEQYGARDVLIPQVTLTRQWPGGPVVASFRAGYGPDNRQLTQFTLRIESADGLPALLDEGVRRIDAAYQTALAGGVLRPDALINYEPPAPAATDEPVTDEEGLIEENGSATGPATSARITVSIQFDTPDATDVAGGEAALRAVPGVRSAATTSLALGGVSVMRVTFDGDQQTLAAALQARGWQVQQGADTLRIRRPGRGAGQ